jgi:hypothetical protein
MIIYLQWTPSNLTLINRRPTPHNKEKDVKTTERREATQGEKEQENALPR